MDEVTGERAIRETPRRRHRPWMRWTLLILALLLAYAVVIEPQWLAVERVEVRLPRLPAALDGFTIVQMSDFHFNPYTWPAKTRSAVRIANDMHPDLIVLTGDYVMHQAADAEPCARMLGDLHATHGVLAVLGNHDLWTDAERVTGALTACGIRVLRNESMLVTRGAARLWIVGLDDAWSGSPDLPRALAGIPPGEATVLLVHEPDFADEAASYPIDLQLSGHSHGGQVRIPGLGAPVVPHMSKKYRFGLHHVRGLPLYVTRGVGTSGPPPLRFNCRPEITVVTLRAGAK